MVDQLRGPSVQLTEEEIRRVRELRKKEPAKAAKLQRRLKNRKQKKVKASGRTTVDVRSAALNDIAVLRESDADNDDDEFVVSDMENSLAEFAAAQEGGSLIDEGFSDLRAVYTRFTSREETRAAGKLGPGEEYVEYTNEAEDTAEEYRRKKDMLDDDEDDDDDVEIPRHGMSKKKLKQMKRPTISYLKQICSRPECVEAWDATAPDPLTLVFLKAHRNTVTVPAHWSYKRRYLQGKRGVERSNFALPHYIEATKITEIRSAIEEKDSKKTLKQRMREKSRPRHRKLNIDYQTLHDAFFKYATKPIFTKFGDMYFEGKETEMHFRRYVPGKLSERCKESLAMTSALDAPPWLLNMQRYGPPPSYPNMVVPGVNAHIPEGAALGFQPGGWGRPPSLDQLKVWGVTPRFEEVVLGEDDIEGPETGTEMGFWGALQTLESEEEEVIEDEAAGEDMESEALYSCCSSLSNGPDSAIICSIPGSLAVAWSGYKPDLDQTDEVEEEPSVEGAATPMLIDPSGLTSMVLAGGLVSAGTTGLESVDLRRTGFMTDGTPKPYTILEQQKAPAQIAAMLGGAATPLDRA